MYQEIKIQMPIGSRLVGARTEGDTVIIVYDDVDNCTPSPPEPKRRKIGFVKQEKIDKSE